MGKFLRGAFLGGLLALVVLLACGAAVGAGGATLGSQQQGPQFFALFFLRSFGLPVIGVCALAGGLISLFRPPPPPPSAPDPLALDLPPDLKNLPDVD